MVAESGSCVRSGVSHTWPRSGRSSIKSRWSPNRHCGTTVMRRWVSGRKLVYPQVYLGEGSRKNRPLHLLPGAFACSRESFCAKNGILDR